MKVLEFETSKCRFKLIDMPEKVSINGWSGAIVIDELNQIPQEKYAKGFYLKNITEEQASDIVDDELYDYVLFRGHLQNYCETAIESLHSLLESKGIHLFENPYSDAQRYTDTEYFDALDKTFYNPYIFKL